MRRTASAYLFKWSNVSIVLVYVALMLITAAMYLFCPYYIPKATYIAAFVLLTLVFTVILAPNCLAASHIAQDETSGAQVMANKDAVLKWAQQTGDASLIYKVRYAPLYREDEQAVFDNEMVSKLETISVDEMKRLLG